MKQATMVLEGGATRGIFTSGVLDYLMERDLYFSNIIGVSAGSCNAVSYVSKQPGRMKACTVHNEKEYDYYYGVRKFFKERSIMNMDMLFDKYPKELFPFDFDTYFASETECEIVVTNCITGEAEYKTEEKDGERLMRLCRASSSMPLLAPIVDIDGTPYLDGGVADSIPIRRAVSKGNDKIVVILTKNAGYRKKLPSKAIARLYRKAYASYPNLVRTALRRSQMYNRTMNELDVLERKGKIFVIRPQTVLVSRLERNHEKLRKFYEHGYQQMEREYENLRRYLDE